MNDLIIIERKENGILKVSYSTGEFLEPRKYWLVKSKNELHKKIDIILRG